MVTTPRFRQRQSRTRTSPFSCMMRIMSHTLLGVESVKMDTRRGTSSTVLRWWRMAGMPCAPPCAPLRLSVSRGTLATAVSSIVGWRCCCPHAAAMLRVRVRSSARCVQHCSLVLCHQRCSPHTGSTPLRLIRASALQQEACESVYSCFIMLAQDADWCRGGCRCMTGGVRGQPTCLAAHVCDPGCT